MPIGAWSLEEMDLMVRQLHIDLQIERSKDPPQVEIDRALAEALHIGEDLIALEKMALKVALALRRWSLPCI